MADPEDVQHVCELCGLGGMPEVELRTHMLLVHVEGHALTGSRVVLDAGSLDSHSKENLITPESEDGHYLESGKGLSLSKKKKQIHLFCKDLWRLYCKSIRK
jgi:hypothetical protein